MINFFVFFIHKLFNNWLQFMGFGLHGLLMLESLVSRARKRFTNKKKVLNNNNNNILLL